MGGGYCPSSHPRGAAQTQIHVSKPHLPLRIVGSRSRSLGQVSDQLVGTTAIQSVDLQRASGGGSRHRHVRQTIDRLDGAPVGIDRLDPGDLQEGMTAAHAIGDDTLQKESQGRVVEASFTHGTSAQRMTWLKRGMDTGDPNQCNTFNGGI